MEKITVVFHLYNDFSGSPKALLNVLKQKVADGERIEVITSDTTGALSELKSCRNVVFHTYSYSFSNNRFVTSIRYLVVQLYTFFFAFRYLFRNDVVFYINTILPVAPAVAGRIMRKPVVYHYHENAFVKGALYRFLCRCMERLASQIICVSYYQAAFLKRKENVKVEYNALSDDFLSELHPDVDAAFERKTVLMIASLKKYKGIVQFVQIASALPDYKFLLVVNDCQKNIDSFFQEEGVCLPANLTVFPRQDDVARFYDRSSVVLNLSDRNLFIETFGLTALEAMSDAIPVIVPTVGGIAELVTDGVNGYKIDVQNIDSIVDHISLLLNDKALYAKMADNALKTSRKINNIT